MSMPPPSGPSKKARSPSIVRTQAPNSLMSDLSELRKPVEPGVLADAISKLDTLRMTKTPGASVAASAATSPAASASASGASSPKAGVERANPLGSDVKTPTSVPGTPHFGAQTEM
jgi:6-phosphofructo-2-kinase/fructose-2,6-biphosphatase 2